MSESMKLRFYARGDLKVYEPKRVSIIGAPRYIGRRFVPAEITPDGTKVLKAASCPATEEPWVCDPISEAGVELMVDLLRASMRATSQEIELGMHHLPLWPADKATAERIGVPFIDVKFVAGAWIDPAETSKRAVLKGRAPKADGEKKKSGASAA